MSVCFIGGTLTSIVDTKASVIKWGDETNLHSLISKANDPLNNNW